MNAFAVGFVMENPARRAHAACALERAIFPDLTFQLPLAPTGQAALRLDQV
jgi:hypothetical protein